MIVNIFLLCYNEEIIIESTILHYKKYLPNCKITFYDNESTDNSVNIAKKYGCSVISWQSNNMIDDDQYIKIKDNCWKNVPNNEWVIVGDMDEFLCITEKELEEEDKNGTTILNIEGYNVIGESIRIDLKDINLLTINKAIKNWTWESKKLCFKKGKIINMNYSNPGAHHCNPVGNIKYSEKIYINKHMEFLGLPFIIDKIKKRRFLRMNPKRIMDHYNLDEQTIINNYNNNLKNCEFFTEQL